MYLQVRRYQSLRDLWVLLYTSYGTLIAISLYIFNPISIEYTLSFSLFKHLIARYATYEMSVT